MTTTPVTMLMTITMTKKMLTMLMLIKIIVSMAEKEKLNRDHLSRRDHFYQFMSNASISYFRLLNASVLFILQGKIFPSRY